MCAVSAIAGMALGETNFHVQRVNQLEAVSVVCKLVLCGNGVGHPESHREDIRPSANVETAYVRKGKTGSIETFPSPSETNITFKYSHNVMKLDSSTDCHSIKKRRTWDHGVCLAQRIIENRYPLHFRSQRFFC